MNKRGFQHIEMIIAFIMFIGFIIFGLYFFNPLDTTRVVGSSLQYASDSIVKNTTEDLKIYGVVLNIDPSEKVIAVPLKDLGNKGVRVETAEGKTLKSYYELEGCPIGQECNPSHEYLYIESPNNKFDIKIFYIKVGNFKLVSQNIGANQKLTDGQFTISSSEKRSVIRYESFNELAKYYAQNYTQLKKNFNLPGRIDFEFSLNSTAGFLQGNRTIPEGVDVRSSSERREIMDNNGSLSFGDLTVRVW